MNIFSLFLDTLIPPQCTSCKRLTPQGLCSSCLNRISPHIIMSISSNTPPSFFFRQASHTISETLSHKHPHLKTVLSIIPFRDPLVRETIHRFKYQNIQSLSYPLSRIMLQHLAHLLQFRQPFLLCPVPLHPKRQTFRGYNQSTLLANHLAQDLNMKLYTDIIRTRHTQPQMSFPHIQARKKNIFEAFQATPKKPTDPSTILIIDDVTTTLSTLSEVATALHKAGFQDIYAITLAR